MENTSAPTQTEKKKRGRPSLEKASDEAPKRQRGRPSRASLESQGEAEEQQPQPQKAPGAGKRVGQNRRGEQQEPQGDEQEEEETQEAPAQRTKPSKGNKADKSSDQRKEQAPTKKPKRPSQTSQQADEDTSADEEIPRSPPKPYLHVSEHVIHVPQSTIDSKWSPLNDPSIQNATTTLSLAHRPVIQTVATNRQAQLHATAVLDHVGNRITRRIKKGLPFPPATSTAARSRALSKRDARSVELDFESVINGVAVLQGQLEPLLHSVELLKRAKQKHEEELEKDYISLQNLEAGARGQARERKQLLKKAHPMAPENTVAKNEDLEMVFEKSKRGTAFKVRSYCIGRKYFKAYLTTEFRTLRMRS